MIMDSFIRKKGVVLILSYVYFFYTVNKKYKTVACCENKF